VQGFEQEVSAMMELDRVCKSAARRVALRPWVCVASAAALLLGLASTTASASGGEQPRLSDLAGPVAALVMHQGVLVAGGEFTGAGGAVQYLARWTGSCWESFEPQLDGPVTSLAIVQGDLIVGGLFEHAGLLPVAHIARWNGTTWSALGAGTDGPVYALLVQADIVLYVGGAFTHAGGFAAGSVARVIGTTWTPLAAGLEGQVNALALHNGNLVAGGDFQVSGPDPWERNLARFVNNEWYSIARGIDGRIFALASYRGSLIAAGDFMHVDFVTRAHHIASFMGEWYPIGFGFGELDSLDTSQVRSLIVRGDDLIAGGTFALADLVTAGCVARWSGDSWLPLGQGTDGPVNALVADGDVLYAGGEFHCAGGQTCGHIAGFRGVDWAPMSTVPIAVEEFRGTATPAGVQLTWRMPLEARLEVAAIGVERAGQAAGPFAAITAYEPSLAPEMVYFDAGAPDCDAVWYRLVLVGRDGVHTTAGPVRVDLRVSTPTMLAVPQELGGGNGVRFRFALARPQRACLSIFDVRGRLICSLDAGVVAPGEHVQIWDRRDASGARVRRGTYLVRLEAGGTSAVRKLNILQP
jgi:hypothetical protein